MIAGFPVGLDAVLVALIGAGVLHLLRGRRASRLVSALIPLLCLLLLLRAALLGLAPDRVALSLGLLAAFVALTEAVADPGGPLRAAMLAGVLLATMADNLFLSWAGALIATACLPSARSGMVPILLLLALLGTVLLALAARQAVGSGLMPLAWSVLLPQGGRCDAALLSLGFAFLLVGYGGIAGLVPLQGWLRDGMGTALLMPFTNIGLLVLLRARVLLAANPAALDAGAPLLVLGLISLLAAGVALWHRAEAGRFVAWAAIGQAGLVATAIGIGGSGASFAALLAMLLRTLSLTACTQALRAAGGFGAAGLLARARPLALAAGAALLGAASLPPTGGFGALLLVATEILAARPLLAIPLGIGVIAMALATLAALHGLWLGGGPSARTVPAREGVAMAWVNVAAALVLGLLLPGAVSAWVGLR